MGGEFKGDFTDLTELQDEIRVKDGEEKKTGLDSKFETFFEKPYEEIKSVLDAYIQDGATIVDIGAGVGNLEEYIDSAKKGCKIDCVDVDEDSVNKLNGKHFQNTEVNVTVSDANEYLKNYGKNNIDIVLINATLHEINNPDDQSGYLDNLLEKLNKILGPNGIIIIGDYYYSDSVTDKEVSEFIEFQKATINHADSRNKFVKPGLVEEKAAENGFEAESSREIRAVKQIDRRYYVTVLKKVK